jgi:hypothetical protein
MSKHRSLQIFVKVNIEVYKINSYPSIKTKG